MKIKFLSFTVVLLVSSLSAKTEKIDLTKAYDMPNASELIEKDALAPATVYTMTKSCKLDDSEAIARGKFIYHNLNGKKVKKKPPKGLAKFVVNKKGKKKAKQYGNCVACHNIEGAVGGGNIGPDLTNYKTNFVDTKVRDAKYVYQKIADPRIDNPMTHMTVNLTTKLFNEQEICDITAYIMSPKIK